MNLKDKTKGIPKIYLLNLKEREDRLEIMETQFEKYKINNYEVFNASKYTPKNFEEWNSKLIYDFDVDNSPHYIKIYMGIMLSWFQIIEKWLTDTNDPYMIMLEDDYNLSPIEHWHFDWEYLMDNIPYDWDSIQLGFENANLYPCFLHPTLRTSGTGAWMINRPYAHKLLRLHKKENRLNICNKDYKLSSYAMKSYDCYGDLKEFPWLQPNYAIVKNGKNYCAPLLYVSSGLGRSNYKNANVHPVFKVMEEACLLWWTEKRDQYTLDDFFTYGKPNDLVFRIRGDKIVNR